MNSFQVRSRSRSEMMDITSQVQAVVAGSGVECGACVVFVPHTTAGVTINENADPDVCRDILEALERAVPWQRDYRHSEGNAAAHVKASLMGSACTVLIRGGSLVLGTWQGIYFCEFDGPRQRSIHVQVIPSA